MRRLALLVFVCILAVASPLAAQRGPEATAAEPFKLGTFEIDGTPRIALVLQDKIVIDLAAANSALERNRAYPALPMPDDMRKLIGH